jgi:hypothetical protein
METHAIVKPYYDLGDKSLQQTSFFFLEHILKARADLHLESGHHEHDQEVNVYLCGLMNSLVDAKELIRGREYVSIFDIDVRRWLDEHPGTRNEYIVYRDNADFGLLQEGVFQGDEHPGSYHHIVLPETTRQDRIVLYYELAASALSHLQGTHGPLVPVFLSLAHHMVEILHIVRRAAGFYFEMLDRISEGSLFHLEREMNEKAMMRQYRELLDEFLKIYQKYRSAPCPEERERLMQIAANLHVLNNEFRCDELRG